MKTTLIIAFTLLTSISFSQLVPKAELEQFWNSNILSILKIDKEAIIAQTNLPLDGAWGYMVDDLSEPESWTQELYSNNLEKIYTEEIRIAMRSKTINDLAHFTTDEGETALLLSIMIETYDKESDMTFESSYMFFFKKIDGNWKLFKMDIAG
jgi:hypothetical protein